jgi:carbamate kinase
MESYQAEGHFKAGSMGPKVDASLRFARSGGTAVIANLLELEAALAGKAGTRIVQAAGRDSVSTVATDLERGVA